mmetsp:Transcript_55413/g.113301  ORF Transcript_55413/g.113301 Transcript_55413/m.113301 type:complete len:269 (+) Transcript_55413:1190-1996(+)
MDAVGEVEVVEHPHDRPARVTRVAEDRLLGHAVDDADVLVLLPRKLPLVVLADVEMPAVGADVDVGQHKRLRVALVQLLLHQRIPRMGNRHVCQSCATVRASSRREEQLRLGVSEFRERPEPPGDRASVIADSARLADAVAAHGVGAGREDRGDGEVRSTRLDILDVHALVEVLVLGLVERHGELIAHELEPLRQREPIRDDLLEVHVIRGVLPPEIARKRPQLVNTLLCTARLELGWPSKEPSTAETHRALGLNQRHVCAGGLDVGC